MSEKHRKLKYLLFKLASVLVSCALPIFAVCEHFPVWTTVYGTSRSLGAGAVICLIIIATVFRRSVFQFMRDKMKLRHAPPLAVWLIMLTASYVLLYISRFLSDLTTVFWFGLVGCAIGTVLTFIAENRYGKKEDP
jgi:ABC-type xylose transport system permease subunit